MEMAQRLLEPVTSHCVVGKTGSVRGYGRFVGKRSGDESSSACTAPTLDQTASSPRGARCSASTTVRIRSLSHLPTTTTGEHKSVATTSTAYSILLHRSVSCHTHSRARKQSLDQIWRRCWRLALKMDLPDAREVVRNILPPRRVTAMLRYPDRRRLGSHQPRHPSRHCHLRCQEKQER